MNLAFLGTGADKVYASLSRLFDKDVCVLFAYLLSYLCVCVCVCVSVSVHLIVHVWCAFTCVSGGGGTQLLSGSRNAWF